MFEFLKKKVAAFTEKVKAKLEAKAESAEGKAAEEVPAVSEKPAEVSAPVEKKHKAEEPHKAEKPAKEKPGQKAAEEIEAEEAAAEERPFPEEAETEAAPSEAETAEEPEFAEEAEPELAAEPAAEAPEAQEEFEPMLPPEKKRVLKAKVSVGAKIKGFLRGKVKVETKDIADFLSELELALLEGDVEQGTAEEIASEMRRQLVGKEVPRGEDVTEFLKRELRVVLMRVMHTERLDLLSEIAAKGKKPFVILFLGPNGAGKTTTIAKLTHLLQKRGKRVVWAASDTFRAASIEQLEKHAEKLGVRVVKHTYGADPAAVAFDAIKAAEAKKVDVVMIDSAGRQETNKNLMAELEKIARVAKPDMKIYVGEAYTGQALLQQAAEFNERLGIDGFILTKIDCDAKGGTAISLLYRLKKPILYIGMGQGYADLKEFEPEFILDRVLG
ncbi:MAG: signal recognition particle-docking protein FtsY [Candidatus Diapherotrites archaeon]